MTAHSETGSLLPLDRTRAALAEFDRLGALMDAFDGTVDEAVVLIASYDRAQAGVGESFYLDTADRNRPECAAFSMCPAGLDFMRRMVDRRQS
jgi:hypothetical protein